MAFKNYIFTATGAGQWVIPGDFDPATATITVIGGGAGGGRGTAGANASRGGGGGGAYGKSNASALTNYTTVLVPGATVYYNIGAGGTGATANGTNGTGGGNTWFNHTAPSAPTSTSTGVLAAGGTAATGTAGGAGGTTANSFASTEFAGGSGGTAASTRAGGGGGGGAGRPNAAGGTGGGSGNATGSGGGGGGGDAGNGTASAASSGSSGGAGGSDGTTSAPGGAGTTGDNGTNGTLGGGGGGSGGRTGTGAICGNGGAGGAGDNISLSGTVYVNGTVSGITAIGSGGGGGGGGGASSTNTGNTGGSGGAGGAYGGGGGSGGGATTTTGNGGNGGNGVLLITYDARTSNRTLYWVGGSGTWDSSSSTNWATTSGGTAEAGLVPGSTDRVVFDANSGGGTVTIGFGASCDEWDVTSGTITFNAGGGGPTLTIGSTISPGVGIDFTGGTVSMGAGMVNLSVTAYMGQGSAITACTLTCNTFFIIPKATLGGPFSMSMQSVNITGDVIFDTASDLSSATATLNISSTGTGLTINGNLTVNGVGSTGYKYTINTGTVGLSFNGNVTFNSNTALGASPVLKYTGTSGSKTINLGSVTPGTLTGSGGTTGLILGSGGTSVLTLTNLGALTSVDLTGYTGTITLGSNLTVNGNVTLGSGTSTGSSAFDLVVNAASTFTSNGRTINNNVRMSAAAATVTLADAITLGSSSTLSVEEGTFTTSASNFAVTCGLFSSSNANTRSITLNGSTVTLTGTGTVWDLTTTTGLTYSGASATINITNTSTTAKTFQSGARTYGTVNVGNGDTGDCIYNFHGAATYATFTTNKTGPYTLRFENGLTHTFSTRFSVGILVPETSNAVGYGRMTLTSISGAAVATLAVPANAYVQNCAYSYITATGNTINVMDDSNQGTSATNFTSRGFARFAVATGTWNSTNTTIWSGNTGGTAGAPPPNGSSEISITAASLTITKTGNTSFTCSSFFHSNSTLSGLSFVSCDRNINIMVSSGSVTSVFSFGSSARSVSTNTQGISVTGSGSVSVGTQNAPIFFNSFTGTWTNAGGSTIRRDLTLSSGMTIAASASTLTLNGTFYISSAGVVYDCPVTKTGSTTVTLNDAMTLGSSRTFTLDQGTINLQTYTLTAGSFSSNNSNTRNLTFSSGANVTLTSQDGSTIYDTSVQTGLTYTGTNDFRITASSTTGQRRVYTGTSTTVLANFTITGTDSTAANGIAFRATSSNNLAVVGNIIASGYTGTIITAGDLQVYGNFATKSDTSMRTGANNTAIPIVATGDMIVDIVGTTSTTFVHPNSSNSIRVYMSKTSGTVTLAGASFFELLDISCSLTTNNFNVSADNQIVISGSNVRTVNLGSSAISISGGSNNWNVQSTTNLTFNAGTSTMTLSGGGTFAGGGLTYNNVVWAAPGSYLASRLFTGNNTFTNLTLNSLNPGYGSVQDVSLVNTTQTVTGTFTSAGANGYNRVLISNGTISAASVSLTDTDFYKMTATGAATWSGTRLGDAGGNSGITFPTAKTVYWNFPAGGSFLANAFATSSGGTVATTNFPLPQDTLIIDDTGLTNGNTITFFNGASYFYPNITITKTGPHTINYEPSSLIYYTGNLTLSSSTTVTVSSPASEIQFIRGGTSTLTLTTNGAVISSNLIISLPDASNITTLRLGSALTGGSSISIAGSNNNFDTMGYNITTPSISIATASQIGLNSSTVTLTGTGTVWNAVGNVAEGTSTIILSDTSTTGKTFAGGGRSYNNVVLGAGAGACTYTISGSNTFERLTSNKTSAFTLSLTTSATQTVRYWNVKGFASNLVTITSTVAGPATIAAASGVTGVVLDYASISNITASPVSTFFATNSTNVSGNTNITFSAPTATTRYWVGGTDTWNATAGTKWSWFSGQNGGAGVPSSTTDVYFDAISGSGTVTVSGTVNSKILDFDGFTGTLSGTTSSIIQIYGSTARFSSGMTVSWTPYFSNSYTSNFNLIFRSGTCNLTTNGKTLPSIQAFNAATISLQDALTTSGQLNLDIGTLTTNNYSVSAVTLYAGSSGTLNLGSSSITLTGGNTVSGVQLQTINLNAAAVVNAGTSTITLTGTVGTGTISTQFNGKTFYNLVVNGVSATLSGAPTFNNVTVDGPSTPSSIYLTLAGPTGPTINGALTINGSNGNKRVRVGGLASAGSVSLTDVDFSFFTGTGNGGNPWTGTRIGVNGVTGITGTSPKTVYWNYAAGGNYYTGDVFALSSGGTASSLNFPLYQDTLIIDNAGLTTGNTITVPETIGNTTVTRTNAFTLDFGSSVVYAVGDLTFSSATTITASSALYAYKGLAATGYTTNPANITITANGAVLPFSQVLAYICDITLGSALTMTGILYISPYGGFDNSGYNVTCGTAYLAPSTSPMGFQFASGTLTITGAVNALYLGAGTGAGFNFGTSTIILSDTTTTKKDIISGVANVTFNNLVLGAGAGNCTYAFTAASANFDSNIFNSISSNKTDPYTITISGGRTLQVKSFIAKGSTGKLLTLTSTNTTPATLTKAGGGYGVIDYATVSYITGSPSSTWYATNSTDGGNNTNITFGNPPSTGNFFLLFYV